MNLEIEHLFYVTFSTSHKTRLLGGADEPFYAPAGAGEALNTIWYRADYPTSALHEVAHWCIASAMRRTLPDYGYWYEGDRDAEAQHSFEAVEVGPQALEWIFSESCGLAFHESIDNLSYPEADSSAFRGRIANAAHAMLRDGLPLRAGRFVTALEGRFGGNAWAGTYR